MEDVDIFKIKLAAQAPGQVSQRPSDPPSLKPNPSGDEDFNLEFRGSW